tara:strand:+ start:229 stop:402 length:174 start_codon:yes stop_codon:yes gene_type:complete
MKAAAFKLVATVLSIQLLIMAGVLIGCFRTQKCDGSRVSELMTYITAQSFALYAAEK